MIESRARKAAFLREVARELGLSHVRVFAERFEEIAMQSDVSNSVDLITARAVRIDTEFGAVVFRLLRPKGQLFLFESQQQPSRTLPFESVQTLELLPASDSKLLILTRQ